MSIRKLLPLFIILITGLPSLHAQKDLHIGMTANEFKAQLPGVIPDSMVYNEDLHLKEKLYTIDGEWTFAFGNNNLHSAVFRNETRISSESDFSNWINSARSVIRDYMKTYGNPLRYDSGSNKYLDRNKYEYETSIGKREILHEAVWESNNVRILISCDYRSNYYEDFMEGQISNPTEWYYYSFKIVHSSIVKSKQAEPDKKGQFYLGMKVEDFAKAYPQLFPNGIGMTGQWGREQVVRGLAGDWNYSFENGKLTWILFDDYIDEINEANFNKCLVATRQLIRDYTQIYGKPDNLETGDTTFRDPYKKKHWGYDVIIAKWYNAKGMKIKIEFTFMGGKGDYHFLVAINYFDKDYPYFD